MRKYNNLNGEVWTTEDDLLLAETVLKMVKEGNAVIDACREIEVVTNGRRTASASKYRWHTKLKAMYEELYAKAKEEGRKVRSFKTGKVNNDERYEDLVENVLAVEEREITLDDIMVLMKKYKAQENNRVTHKYEDEVHKLRRENELMKREIAKTKEALKELTAKHQELKKEHELFYNALKTLKDDGIDTPISSDVMTKYKVNLDGTIELA